MSKFLPALKHKVLPLSESRVESTCVVKSKIGEQNNSYRKFPIFEQNVRTIQKTIKTEEKTFSYERGE